MNYRNIKDIRAFIGKYVSDKVEAGELVNQTWATTDILSKYDGIQGDDKDFYLITARQWVNDEVKSSIKRFDDDSAGENSQYVLDGFDHLRQAYPIKRGGVRCIVPIEQCTNDELLAKAQEHYSLAEANVQHGDEIVQYVESRQQAV